jgi:hypothetical protein
VAPNRVVKEIAHALRILALAFFAIGLSTAAAVIRIVQYHQVASLGWSLVTVGFALIFFGLGLYLWGQARVISGINRTMSDRSM